MVDLSQAQLDSTQAQIDYAAAKYEYQMESVKLDYVTGAQKYQTPLAGGRRGD